MRMPKAKKLVLLRTPQANAMSPRSGRLAMCEGVA